MTRALVLGRARKGKPIGERTDAAVARLTEAGWDVESAIVKRKKALTKRAAKAVAGGVDAVVVVGGDGGVLRVVQALAESKVALGIVPTGTGNLVATNLEIPRDLDGALGCLLAEGRRTIDLGRAEVGGDRWWFAVACGVGLDAEVMDATSRRQKVRWGRLAYLASLVRKSGAVREVRHDLRIDGKPTRVVAMQLLIANFGRTGLGVKPRLEVEPADGLLDIIVLRGRGRADGLLAAWEAIRQGGHGQSRGGRAYRARAREVEVATSPKRPVEVDGTVVGTTPVRVEVRPAALTVIAPRAETT